MLALVVWKDWPKLNLVVVSRNLICKYLTLKFIECFTEFLISNLRLDWEKNVYQSKFNFFYSYSDAVKKTYIALCKINVDEYSLIHVAKKG